jgi:ferredoxin
MAALASSRTLAAPARPAAQRRTQAARCRAAAVPTVQVTAKEGGETTTFEMESNEQLRAALLAEKVDLYTTWGKVWSCGGAGQCGTCIVDVVSASDACLSERSETEQKKLKGKPASWRLACQTYVGDGETSGQSVVVATKPQ